MVGSRKYLTYFDDNFETWVYSADESIAELPPRAVDYTIETGTIYELPRGLRPRDAWYRSSDGLSTRRKVIAFDFQWSSLNIGSSTITLPGTPPLVLTLYRKRAERRPIIGGVDTGLVDGDAT
jgi:hypothetical protein